MSTPADNVEAPLPPRPGDLLRSAREQRGLSPQQAAHEMRIDLATLRALENDDYARLGAPIFVKGHLRNYAKHLGLVAEPLVEAYERSATPTPPSLVGYRNEGEQMGGHIELRRWLPVVVVGIVVVLLSLFALWLFRRPPVEAPSTEAVEVASAPATVAAPVVGTVAAAPASVPAPTPTTVAAAPASAPRVEAPVEPARAAVPGQVRLALRFSGESWVEVTDASGQPVVYQLFEAGQSREVAAAPPLRVFLGQAASVSLAVDGRKVDLAPLTKRDATARLTIAANGSVR